MYAKITNENLNDILRELGKTYRKMAGKYAQAELIMVGGAAILSRYNFRATSADVDAIIRADGALKDAAVLVGEKFNLEHDWLNSDFSNTDSYSRKLVEISKHYRTFSNVLEIRTVEPQYLLAMKLRSSREYKHDLGDIVGMVMQERERGSGLSENDVLEAFHDLYGDVDIPEKGLTLLHKAFTTENILQLYEDINAEEARNGELLLQFEKSYPGVLKQENVSAIIKTLSENHSDIPAAKTTSSHPGTSPDPDTLHIQIDDSILVIKQTELFEYAMKYPNLRVINEKGANSTKQKTTEFEYTQ